MQLRKNVLVFVLIVLAFYLLSPIFVSATNVGVNDGSITISQGNVTLNGPQNINNSEEAKATVIEKYKALITFIGGIITVTMVAIFIIQFLKLGTISSNPRDRKEVITGLLISGVSAALMGSITFFVGVFYGLLK